MVKKVYFLFFCVLFAFGAAFAKNPRKEQESIRPGHYKNLTNSSSSCTDDEGGTEILHRVLTTTPSSGLPQGFLVHNEGHVPILAISYLHQMQKCSVSQYVIVQPGKTGILQPSRKSGGGTLNVFFYAVAKDSHGGISADRKGVVCVEDWDECKVRCAYPKGCGDAGKRRMTCSFYGRASRTKKRSIQCIFKSIGLVYQSDFINDQGGHDYGNFFIEQYNITIKEGIDKKRALGLPENASREVRIKVINDHNSPPDCPQAAGGNECLIIFVARHPSKPLYSIRFPLNCKDSHNCYGLSGRGSFSGRPPD